MTPKQPTQSGSGHDEWKRRISEIADTHRDDRSTFIEHLVKHANEPPSTHKYNSTINMFSILMALDGQNYDIFTVGNYWDLMERLDHFDEKMAELMAKEGD